MTTMSDWELARLDCGKVCYIKSLTAGEAKSLWGHDDVDLSEVPDNIVLYQVTNADGSPIALTDSMQAAWGHVISDELMVRALH